MGYDPLIPQPNDRLSVSQGQILGNFTAANTLFDVDHYTFNFGGGAAAPYDLAVAGDKGRHRQLGMIRVSADITTVANEIGVYVKNDTIGNPQLFMRQASNGAVTQITGTNIANNNGQFVLPGGFIMKWGRIVNPGASGQLVYPVGGNNIAFSAAAYALQLTLRRNSGNQSVTIDDTVPPTAAHFNYLCSSAGSAFLYWLAIGSY